jgi:serine/threonine protein kinase
MSWNQGHLLKSGQYEVVRLLGSGGFGMTYLAKDLNLERQVVIKRPNLSFEADRDYDKFLRRFKREGQVLAQVQIPNIVRVIEFTEIGGMPCLVMDFVAGETLNECIRRRKSIPENEAWQLFQKLASAVEALHQKGIIHCDIHPGNIIVQPNGEPMLIDFGSTKLLHPTTWTVTTTVNKDFGPYEQIAESAENALGSQPAWDIYSLAANMFFAVTGQKPMSAISRKLYGDSLKEPKELKPELSDRLNRMILQGMALEAKDRSISVREWIKLLNVSSQPFLQDMLSNSKATELVSENQELRSFSPSLRKQKNSNINFSRPRKKLSTFIFFPRLSIYFLILGHFFQGVVLGNYFGDLAWAWDLAFAFAWFLALAVAFTSSLSESLLWAFVGAWAFFGAWWALAGIGAAFAFSFSGAWAGVGVFIGSQPRIIRQWSKKQDDISYTMVSLSGALLSGGFSGYFTNTGIIWGLCHGLFAWASLMSILIGYNNPKIRDNYSNVQVLLIYSVCLSIGLISGGMLGSWLKVAGILKLP